MNELVSASLECALRGAFMFMAVGGCQTLIGIGRR